MRSHVKIHEYHQVARNKIGYLWVAFKNHRMPWCGIEKSSKSITRHLKIVGKCVAINDSNVLFQECQTTNIQNYFHRIHRMRLKDSALTLIFASPLYRRRRCRCLCLTAKVIVFGAWERCIYNKFDLIMDHNLDHLFSIKISIKLPAANKAPAQKGMQRISKFSN